jgi:hypothetical protein
MHLGTGLSGGSRELATELGAQGVNRGGNSLVERSRLRTMAPCAKGQLKKLNLPNSTSNHKEDHQGALMVHGHHEVQVVEVMVWL